MTKKTKQTRNQSKTEPDFEELYKKLTSDNVRRASDELFKANADDLKKAFKPD